MRLTLPRQGPYGPHWYAVPPAALEMLQKIDWRRPTLAAAWAFLSVLLLVKAYALISSPPVLYPLIAFLIAGRAGILIQLLHEASHGLVSRSGFNDWFGRWCAAYPLGLDLETFRATHTRHHACTSQACDPALDREKYRRCDIKEPSLWLLFLKDLCGITALTVKAGYARALPESAVSLPAWARRQLSIVLVQALILFVLFQGSLGRYLAFWAIPLMTCHMVLMRVKGIAEHGMGVQYGYDNFSADNVLLTEDRDNLGSFITRSVGTPAKSYASRALNGVERLFFGSAGINYHHEHQLFPSVPYYRLPELHRLIAPEVSRFNPEVYAPGYLHCLFLSTRRAAGGRAVAA